ncbi:BLUF domain-containing protein [Variovorax sp. LT1R16]|uniref:BLUF domain-containing protein n=1 Tax=Variovorax sp. LT1R16 TaxID=3443728 RepID=UPI003F48668A
MSETLPFYRLIYTSRVNEPIDLGALLRQAQKNNPSLGITGGLAVLEGVFLQYLEGKEDAVESLFARILPDQRHAHVKVLERRAVPRRMFSDWSMAMLDWTESAKHIFLSFSPGLGLNLYDTDPTTAAPLFRAWAATEDWRRIH